MIAETTLLKWLDERIVTLEEYFEIYPDDDYSEGDLGVCLHMRLIIRTGQLSEPT